MTNYRLIREWADRNGYGDIGGQLAALLEEIGDNVTDEASAYKQASLHTNHNKRLVEAMVEYHKYLVRVTSPAMRI